MAYVLVRHPFRAVSRAIVLSCTIVDVLQHARRVRDMDVPHHNQALLRMIFMQYIHV